MHAWPDCPQDSCEQNLATILWLNGSQYICIFMIRIASFISFFQYKLFTFLGEFLLQKDFFSGSFYLKPVASRTVSVFSVLFSFTRFDLPLLSSVLRHSEKSFKQLSLQSASAAVMFSPSQRMRSALISIESFF